MSTGSVISLGSDAETPGKGGGIDAGAEGGVIEGPRGGTVARGIIARGTFGKARGGGS